MLCLSFPVAEQQSYTTTICLLVKNEYKLWARNCLTLPIANQSCGMNNIMNAAVPSAVLSGRESSVTITITSCQPSALPTESEEPDGAAMINCLPSFMMASAQLRLNSISFSFRMNARAPFYP